MPPAIAPSTAPADSQFRNVVVLGWVAFFGGLAQDMIQPILPALYASVLGLSKEFIGLIERSVAVTKQRLSLGVLRGPFAALVAVMLLFTLGNSSDAFLILRAQDVGVAPVMIPVVYAIFNLVSALAAIPAEKLADRLGRRLMIAAGWGVYALTYLGFAVVSAPWMVWPFYAFYGLFYASTEGSSKALVAELVPSATRGLVLRALQRGHRHHGAAGEPHRWHAVDAVSPAVPFAFGAVLAALSLIGLAFVPTMATTEQV